MTAKSVVYVDSVNYDHDLPHWGTQDGTIPNNDIGVSESSPLMWIEAIENLFARLKTGPVDISAIKAISVSGQQHGLVALDKEGNLTRPRSKLWNDVSTEAECEEITNFVGGQASMINEISNTQRSGYTAGKILHMVRHEPDQYAKTDKLFLVHNYINWYLTGGVAVMEPGDVSGTALWDPVSRQWSKKIISYIDKKLSDKLPPVRASTEIIGNISSKLSNQYGFSQDCMIDGGSGDNMMSAVGTGNVIPGIVTVSLGTSGTAFTIMEEPFVDPSGEVALFCDSTEYYFPLVCVLNMANGYNAFLRKHSLDHSDFDTLINETPPGNRGRLIIPWFAGERTPDVPNAEPIYYGFKLEELERQDLARGLLEGHILNLYAGFKKLPVQPSVIHITGGLAQSSCWVQAIANIFNCEAVPVLGEGAALGASLHAVWAWHLTHPKEVLLEELIAPFILFNENLRMKPQAKYRAVYDKQFLLYQALKSRLLGEPSSDPFSIKY